MQFFTYTPVFIGTLVVFLALGSSFIAMFIAMWLYPRLRIKIKLPGFEFDLDGDR